MATINHRTIFLSVVIPVLNEAEGLTATVEAIVAAGIDLNEPFEIVIVNDGSSDATGEVATVLQHRWQSVRVLTSKKNMGKGHAVKVGVMSARGLNILFLDADLSVPLTNIKKFLSIQREHHADIVIASIELPGATSRDDNRLYRRWGGKVAKKLIRLVVPEIHDTQRGFKLFTAAAASDIFPNVKINGWGFDIEVLAIAQHRNLSIIEVPVQWHNRSGSRVTVWSYLSTLWELLIIKKSLVAGRYQKNKIT